MAIVTTLNMSITCEFSYLLVILPGNSYTARVIKILNTSENQNLFPHLYNGARFKFKGLCYWPGVGHFFMFLHRRQLYF